MKLKRRNPDEPWYTSIWTLLVVFMLLLVVLLWFLFLRAAYQPVSPGPAPSGPGGVQQFPSRQRPALPPIPPAS